eukprot:TRINITY_DN8968_c0_g1_i1.p1 TRINITY_DN8968_c0_g1~~TRINITY_DN8968_c0_g1_i1.p1  ORF type:complete len:697 (-),score=95.17 TRINITY_DN8968_c0_g1_i1:185-2275(-)
MKADLSAEGSFGRNAHDEAMADHAGLLQPRWSTFQARLRLQMEDHCSACERLAKDLLEGSHVTSEDNQDEKLERHVSRGESPRSPLPITSKLFAVECPGPVSSSSTIPAAGEPVGASECMTPQTPVSSDGGEVEMETDTPLDVVCKPNLRNSHWPRKNSKARRLSEVSTKVALTRSYEISRMNLERMSAAFVSSTDLHTHRRASFVEDLINKMRASCNQSPFVMLVLEKMSAMAEPRRDGCLARVEESKWFESMCASMIIINTVFIVMGTDQDMSATAKGIAPEEMRSGLPRIAVEVADMYFCVFYSLELLLRMWVHRFYFFVNADLGWNWLDFILVVTSCFELAVKLAGSAESGDNKMFLRVLRLMKLSKVLRVFRAVRFLQEMRQFVDRLKDCSSSLFWAIVMILLVLLVFALYFVQSLASYLQEATDSDYGDRWRTVITQRFGTVRDAMITLLEISCGHGTWYEYFELMSDTSEMTAFLFVFFNLFFAVAVWNIVTSIFLENTLRKAQPDQETELFEKHKRDVEDAKELMGFILKADADASGMLSREEFNDFLKDDKFRAYFDMRGIDVKDANVFFDMLTTSIENDEVDLESFVGSCLRVKGNATSIDLHSLAFENKMMHQVQSRFNNFVEERFNNIDEKLTMLGTHFRGTCGVVATSRPQHCGCQGSPRSFVVEPAIGVEIRRSDDVTFLTM